MNVPAEYYIGAHSLQRQEAKYIISRYSKNIQWRSDENDSILDIGSGCGDIANDFILPILPRKFKKFIGVDIAEDMIQTANKRYSKSNVSFEHWDMCSSCESLLRRHPEGFDHIFSFNAINWIPEPKLAYQNIYDVLTMNGDCFLAFPCATDYMDINDAVLSMPKWSKLIKTPKSMPMPYRFEKDRVNIVRNQLDSIGFRRYSVDTYDSSFTFSSMELIKRNVGAVNSNLLLLTPEQKQEYFSDFINVAYDMGLIERMNSPRDAKYTTKYTYLVIYAQK